MPLFNVRVHRCETFVANEPILADNEQQAQNAALVEFYSHTPDYSLVSTSTHACADEEVATKSDLMRAMHPDIPTITVFAENKPEDASGYLTPEGTLPKVVTDRLFHHIKVEPSLEAWDEYAKSMLTPESKGDAGLQARINAFIREHGVEPDFVPEDDEIEVTPLRSAQDIINAFNIGADDTGFAAEERNARLRAADRRIKAFGESIRTEDERVPDYITPEVKRVVGERFLTPKGNKPTTGSLLEQLKASLKEMDDGNA